MPLKGNEGPELECAGDPWVGGGRVLDERRALAAWSQWVRDCELFAGCVPCSSVDFPGPALALADLRQMVGLADQFARSARRAARELGRSCRP